MLAARRTILAAVAALVLAVSACSATTPEAQDRIVTRSAKSPAVTRVLAVSIDGLNPSAIRRLGHRGAPTLHRLIARGAFTMNARTTRELSKTLPNHTGMLTGRRVDASYRGHGVAWNDDRTEPATVDEAAGDKVESVFTSVAAAGRRTAMFAAKTKFSLFKRSWPAAVDRAVIDADNAALVRLARHDLANYSRGFTFVHLSGPDDAGHEHGFMTPAYLGAVRATDRLLGRLVTTIRNHPSLRRHLVLVVTADHGGGGGKRNHADPTLRQNFRIPFLVWGPGVASGVNLYALNRDYRNPGTRRTAYAARKQPVRNSDVANLVTDLLGLPRFAGSEHDARLDLDVR